MTTFHPFDTIPLAVIPQAVVNNLLGAIDDLAESACMDAAPFDPFEVDADIASDWLADSRDALLRSMIEQMARDLFDRGPSYGKHRMVA